MKLFNKNNIKFNVNVKNQREAIVEAGLLLYYLGDIKLSYIDEMLDTYDNLGPYFVIAPGIAFAHSKPSSSVFKSGISLCKLKEPVYFNHEQNDPVDIVFALCGINEEDHIGLLKDLSQFLMDQKNIDLIRNSTYEDQFLENIKNI